MQPFSDLPDSCWVFACYPLNQLIMPLWRSTCLLFTFHPAVHAPLSQALASRTSCTTEHPHRQEYKPCRETLQRVFRRHLNGQRIALGLPDAIASDHPIVLFNRHHPPPSRHTTPCSPFSARFNQFADQPAAPLWSPAAQASSRRRGGWRFVNNL